MPIPPLKLLLVEDSPHDAELTLLTLESSGLKIESTLVYHHQDVERELSAQRFDLILCDYLLPGSSGPEVLDVALRRAPQTPFIFLSGMFGEQHAVEMMRKGAVDYVLKQNLKMLPKAVVRAVLEVQEREKRQRAEQSLKETELRAHLAIEAAEMGGWTYDPRSATLLWDERCKSLFELPEGEQESLSFMYDRCHPDDRELLQQKVAQALAADVGFQIEHRIVIDGAVEGEEERWVFSNGRSLFENGQCVRFTGVMQDITERKAATQALHQLNEMLEERVVRRTRELAATNERLREQIRERERVEAALQQMQRLEVVGQLTAGVAHDFNNLLTVILTSANFLARDLEKGVFTKSPQRLENIRSAGERGARLTSQLLSFSRRQRLEPVALNLNDTIGGMRDLLARALGGSVWVDTELADDLWSALVDPTQTEMIILNLAINARDAMAQGGQLRLGTHNERVERLPERPEDPEPGAYVVLSVSDTGCGMSEEVLAKAFEPFFTTKEVGKGSGLGLAQVFGFAKQSGGGVQIETAEDVGTTIRVFLPSIAQNAQPVREASDMPGDANTDDLHRTILLVDDDPAVRSVTAAMLASLGYSVVEAASGDDALQKIEPGIDLVLTDFAMPNMTGAELAHAIHREHPELPVMFITGFADIDILDVEPHLIVQKPYREDDLARKLAKALMRVGAVAS